MNNTITLLNTSILTNYGQYSYRPASLQEVKEKLTVSGWQSAIGHQATAEILSELLELDVPVNRVEYKQEPNETSVVFKLRGRPPEGAILSREDLEKIGYDFGFLTRLL